MNYFDDITINEIIAMAKDPEDKHNRLAYHHIIEKYKGIIHGTIKKKNYFLQGGDYDDLFQEGLFGVYKAVKDFKPEAGEFETFLKICIDRQLISAVKTATRKKHRPLNEMIPLDRPLPENDNLSMMDILGARGEVQYTVDFESQDPEEQIIFRERHEIEQKMLDDALSDKEKMIHDLYLQDKSYKEIMIALQHLGVTNPKMIDNAIQRVKRKIEKVQNCELLEDLSDINEKNMVK